MRKSYQHQLYHEQHFFHLNENNTLKDLININISFIWMKNEMKKSTLSYTTFLWFKWKKYIKRSHFIHLNEKWNEKIFSLVHRRHRRRVLEQEVLLLPRRLRMKKPFSFEKCSKINQNCSKTFEKCSKSNQNCSKTFEKWSKSTQNRQEVAENVRKMFYGPKILQNTSK